MSSSTTTTETAQTSLLRSRDAIKAFQASKPPAAIAPTSGKYGLYFSPVEEPFEMKRIVSESVSLEGGVAAVLLQIAHPAVAAGVARHSDFTYRRLERSRRTVIYIYAMTFGTPEEKRLISDMTHRAHSRVKGKDYDANDVDLQLWVAATIYWTMVQSYGNCFGKLEDERAERVYREFSVMATALRVPPEKWPGDRVAFREYWDEMVSGLEVTDEARRVAKDVLDQKGLPWGLVWAYATVKGPVSRVITTEMLPENVRRGFGLQSTLYTRQMYALVNRVNSTLVPWLPVSVREFPKNFYMKDLRRRIATGAKL